MKAMRDRSVLLVYDDKSRVLMQHRREDREVLPGYWGFFGGKLKNDESEEEALFREIDEELNYSPLDPQLFVSYSVDRDGREMTLHVFEERYDATQELDLQEGQGMDWISVEEINNYKIPEHDKEILRKWRRQHTD
jgi:mutator protein MutT